MLARMLEFSLLLPAVSTTGHALPTHQEERERGLSPRGFSMWGGVKGKFGDWIWVGAVAWSCAVSLQICILWSSYARKHKRRVGVAMDDLPQLYMGRPGAFLLLQLGGAQWRRQALVQRILGCRRHDHHRYPGSHAHSGLPNVVLPPSALHQRLFASISVRGRACVLLWFRRIPAGRSLNYVLRPPRSFNDSFFCRGITNFEIYSIPFYKC